MTAIPEKTALEKIFLMVEKINTATQSFDRISRHLYDIYMLKEHGVISRALSSQTMFSDILLHRLKFFPLKDFDSSMFTLGTIPTQLNTPLLRAFRADYADTMRNMIYGDDPHPLTV